MALESGSSSSRSGWNYDVFLSFRGETRNNFTGHLFAALVQAGIRTFLDDEMVQGGEPMSPELLMVIPESRIFVVVFSKGYASSTWCLDELLAIIECRRTNEHHIVLPIFYGIDPSDVQKQSGSFKEAFDRHDQRFEMNRVDGWRAALAEAGNLSGWELSAVANGHEPKFIQMIVQDVSKKLNKKLLYVAEHPVGIDSRVHGIINLLNTATKDVCVLGICGMPGIGKTTIAKEVFNRLYNQYERCCFLSNVSEISKRENGLVRLQRQLLSDILHSNDSKIDVKDRGIMLIKDALYWKRVLIVFDEVDELDTLRALVGQKSWFAPGSRMIITTRDEHLLTRFHVHKKFKVEELDKDESLQLFSWHAFRDSHPLEDYLELAYVVVKYCRGLPLALEVLGSSLFKRSKTEWESAIEALRKIPHPYIQKKLRVSFEALLPDYIKHAFLDISCFFIGRDREYVAKILQACYGFGQEISIMTLIERSLLTIDAQNKLRMHDLLRDMGREIVRQMSPEHPGKRNRIWLHEDAWSVLKQQTGTETVKGLTLDLRASEEAVFLRTESFTNMRHLNLLQINGIQLIGSYEHLSKELIWLCWSECPLKSLPSNLRLDNITVLDMQYSNLNKLWKETKCLNKLKILDLSHSKYLVRTPNFIGISNLERLMLEDCPSLIEVHQSIGHLGKLGLLNLERCCKLRNLPQSICGLKSLNTLNLKMCSQLNKLPECLGDMESLTELLLDETAIMQLPTSIGNLRNLRKLSLSGCNYGQDSPSTSWRSLIRSWVSPRSSGSKALLPASCFQMVRLEELNLSNCGLSEGAILFDLRSLSSLKYLNLSGNKFVDLPSDLDMEGKIDMYISEGKATFNVLLVTDSSDNWEPTTLVLRRSGFELKSSGNETVVAAEKFSKDLSIIAAGPSTEVVLTCSDGYSHRLSTCDERMRNTLLLTMSMFQSKALEDEKKVADSVAPSMPRLSYPLKSKLQDQNDQVGCSAASTSKTLEEQQPLEEEPEFFDFDESSSFPKMLQSVEIESEEEPEFFDFDESNSFPEIVQSIENESEDFDESNSFPEMVQSIENESEDCDELSSEIRQLVRPNDIQKKLILVQGGMRLTAPPKVEEWETKEEINLTDNEFSDLPENPRCPVLQALILSRNNKLRKIPPLFFNHMPALQVLNLSRTRIRSLPKSLSRLANLRRIFLNHCHLLMSVSSDVGELKHLEILDLEGTKILELPKEVQKLTKLTELQVSFLEPMHRRRSEQSNALIPTGILSDLSQLEELNIDVSPDDERWNACAKEIVFEVCQLKALDTLTLYLPGVQLLRLFTCFSIPIVLPSLLHFRFTVGHHAKRIMSRLPKDVEFELGCYDRCLKYINGVDVPEEIEEIQKVLRHATAFFLDRHTTAEKLSDFGFGNMKQLRCCVLGECNELQVIGDGDDMISGSADDPAFCFQSLEYLYVYYMKELKSIWTGSLHKPALNGLKFLTFRTCPKLSTIFTPALLINLCQLEELTVDDCPAVRSLISCNILEHTAIVFLPNLKRISLHFLPELTGISGGLRISARLEWMSVYYCPNLKNLPITKEFNRNLKKIKGEMGWWKYLVWESSQQQCWDDIFVPVDVCD